jgi:hypothetical protein
VDGEQAFAEALTAAMMKPTGSVGESAQNMAEAFSTLFAYATLDGVNINPGSNTSAAALEALQLGLEESFSVEEDAEASAEGVEAAQFTVRAECEEAHRIAAEAAGKTQQGQNEQATKEVIVTETVTKTQYRDRIKEVIRYVPKPDTTCPADPEFVRLFNGAD